MITFQCLECDSDLEVDDTPPLGYKIHCAYCGAIFEVVAVDPLEVDWADDDDVGPDDADDLLDIALDDDIILDDDALGDDVLDDDLTELNGAPRRTGAASRANTGNANATPLNDELDETVVDDLSGALGDDPDDDEEEDEEEDDWVFGDDDEEDDDWDFDDDEEDDDWDFDDDEEDDEDSRWT